jgi:amino acid adenylation domain-containing protein
MVTQLNVDENPSTRETYLGNNPNCRICLPEKEQSLSGESPGEQGQSIFSNLNIDALARLAENCETSMCITLVTACLTLFYRYTNQEAVAITYTPTSGDHFFDGEIKDDVKHAQAHVSLSPKDRFIDVLNQVKRLLNEADQQSPISFEVEGLWSENSTPGTSVKHFSFLYGNNTSCNVEEEEVNAAEEDLTLDIGKSADGPEGVWRYNAGVIDPATFNGIRESFGVLLNNVAEHADTPISELALLSPAQKNRLLIDNNNTACDQAVNKSLHELFEEQVLKTPGNTAVVFKDQQLTYKQLNERANQLAHYLKGKGVKEELFVPLLLDRGVEMLIAVLGVLKAGGAFVPMDPNYPSERIGFMLADTDAKIAITNQNNKLHLQAAAGIEIIVLDNDDSINLQPITDLPANVGFHNLAYVIYTSGSTGKPKGVMIEHGCLLNYLLNSKAKYISDDQNGAGSFVHLSYTFDASLTAMFMPLLAGKLIVIGSKHSIEVFEDDNLEKYAPYDFIKATPAHLELLGNTIRKNGDENWLTNKLVVGGEALHPGHLAPFVDKGVDVEIINEYGPTEATVGCCTYNFKAVSDRQRIKNGISIGSPIDNTQIYILDESEHLVPVGSAGEICIGGAGVARGYLKRPELSTLKFIKNPFIENDSGRLYKTGDLGRWLNDGNIEYIGRKDDQVKILGYRLELGEIESAVNNLKYVSSSCVVVKQDNDNIKKLACYYVADYDVMRSMERELFKAQVSNWNELYENEYDQSEIKEHVDPEFNLAGWKNSFTGKAIPGDQMREWLDDIAGIILSGKPKYVLEIGCGMGLIYYQLAGKVKKYTGTDFSSSSIKQIKNRIGKGLRNYGPTTLKVAAANDVTLDEDERVDTIILNSIIQYFPGEGYLTDVIERCIGLSTAEGRIVIGDVRDNRLVKAFQTRKHLQTFDNETSVTDFNWAIEQEVLREKELCVSPEYFYKLPSIFPQITHVDIQWKDCVYENELTLYRYTVNIYTGNQKPGLQPGWQVWDEKDKDHVLQTLGSGKLVALKDLPNPRLTQEILMLKASQDKAVNTISELRKYLISEEPACRIVEEIISAAKEKDYKCRWYVNRDPLKINLLLQPSVSDELIEQPYGELLHAQTTSNIPLLQDIYAGFQKRIHDDLAKHLPSYMVPSEFIGLTSLPLTGNGKVDRLLLSKAKERTYQKSTGYIAPLTKAQQMLASIWQEILGISQAGIQDNFFELGGNSLQAARVFSMIRKMTGRQLPLGILIKAPTIEQLATFIEDEKSVPLWTSLVPIQPLGLKPPIFCIHGGWGNILFYRNLANHLGKEQPLYGLQVKGLNGRDKPFRNMKDMAAHYIAEMRSVQPHGPYYLAGYCYGAIVAFEMAQQLTSENQKIALLANFHGLSPSSLFPENRERYSDALNGSSKGNEPFLTRKRKELLNDFSSHKEQIAKLKTKDKLLYAAKQLRHNVSVCHAMFKSVRREITFRYCAKVGKVMPDRLLKFYLLDTMTESQKKYLPLKYQGEMIVFRSPEIFGDPHLGWTELVAGGIKTIDIPGDHPDRTYIMQEPFIGDVAKELKKHLP